MPKSALAIAVVGIEIASVVFGLPEKQRSRNIAMLLIN